MRNWCFFIFIIFFSNAISASLFKISPYIFSCWFLKLMTTWQLLDWNTFWSSNTNILKGQPFKKCNLTSTFPATEYFHLQYIEKDPLRCRNFNIMMEISLIKVKWWNRAHILNKRNHSKIFNSNLALHLYILICISKWPYHVSTLLSLLNVPHNSLIKYLFRISHII